MLESSAFSCIIVAFSNTHSLIKIINQYTFDAFKFRTKFFVEQKHAIRAREM